MIQQGQINYLPFWYSACQQYYQKGKQITSGYCIHLPFWQGHPTKRANGSHQLPLLHLPFWQVTVIFCHFEPILRLFHNTIYIIISRCASVCLSVCLCIFFSKTVKARNLILFATSPGTKGGGLEIETKISECFLNWLIS